MKSKMWCWGYLMRAEECVFMNKNYNDMSSQSGIGIDLMIYAACSFSYRPQISERAACSGLAKVIINIMEMHLTLK